MRPPNTFDEADGTRLGQILFLKLYPDRQHPQELREKIGELIRTMNVLRSAQAKYR